MIERVKAFAERLLREAQNSNNLDFIHNRFDVACGAVCFIIEEMRDNDLAEWWNEEMRYKFYELINQKVNEIDFSNKNLE